MSAYALARPRLDRLHLDRLGRGRFRGAIPVSPRVSNSMYSRPGDKERR
jgi:hypothetical protein